LIIEGMLYVFPQDTKKTPFASKGRFF